MLSVLLFFFWQPGWGALDPAWSPDREVLATTKVSDRFATPEGANYALLLNGRMVYPKPTKKSSAFSAYQNQHTFLTELAWSPDSQNLAFLEKIYDWEYSDPYNGYFDGSVSNERYYLVIISRKGEAAGYVMQRVSANSKVVWRAASKVAVNGQVFNLDAKPPSPIN